VSVLKTIRYGEVEIRFQTEARPDPITVATGAGLVTNGRRLQVIDEFARGQRIRAYALRYTVHSDASRQSFLQSVQQYGSDAIVDADGVHGPSALPAIRFDAAQTGSAATWLPRTPAGVADWAANWPSGPDDSSRYAAILDGGPQGEVPWPVQPQDLPPFANARWVTLDLNGDKRTDFALVTPTADQAFDVRVELTLPDDGYRGVSTRVPWP